MDTNFFLLIIAFALLALGIVTWRRRMGGAPELSLVEEFKQATAVAGDLVAAAEQLWQSGRLPKNARYNWVYDQLKVMFPGLTDYQRDALIEAAVYWLKQGAERLQIELGEQSGA